MSGIGQETSVRRPHVRCMIKMADIKSVRCKEARGIQVILVMRNCFLDWLKHALYVKIRVSMFVRLWE